MNQPYPPQPGQQAYPQQPYPPQQGYPQQQYQPVPPPMPPQTLGYASPRMTQPTYGYGLWRQGDRIVATRDIDLGDACVKCGAACDGWRWNKTLYWHEPWVYILILPGILIYAICALVLRKSARVSAGLCPAHRKRRNIGMLIVWILSLLGVACLIGGPVLAGNYDNAALGVSGVLLAFALWIVAVILGNSRVRVLAPKKIDDHYAWFGGAGEAYLQMLQPIA